MTAVNLTAKELAFRIKVHPKTLSKWRTQGCGPKFLKVSYRIIVYPLTEVEAWEASRLQRSTLG